MQLSLNFKQLVMLSILVFFIFIIFYFYFSNIYEGLDNQTEDSLDKDQVSKIKTHLSDIRRTITNMENILYTQKDNSDKKDKDSSDKDSSKKKDKKT
jgi:hypothetical protein